MSGRVFVCNEFAKGITVIDARDLSVAGTVGVGGAPMRAMADGHGKLFVTVFERSQVLRIDGKTLQIEGRFDISPGEECHGLAYDRTRGLVFASCVNEHLVVLDGASGKIVVAQPLGNRAGDLISDKDGLLLTADGHGMMSVFAPPEGGARGGPYRHVQDIPTGLWARSLAQDPATGRVYVPFAEYRSGRSGEQELKPGSFRVVVLEPANK